MPQITLIYAGVFALLAVLLANLVLFVRLRPQTQPKWRAAATERVQANFVENVPLALMLLLVLELAEFSAGWLHGFGASLLVARVLHAYGLARYPGANYPRLIGAQGTFLILSLMGAAALVRGVTLLA